MEHNKLFITTPLQDNIRPGNCCLARQIWPYVIFRLTRGTYHYWRTKLRHSKHFRKSKEDQFNGKMATDTYTVRRTAEIEWRRRKMGWSSATGERKTAVALLKLTGEIYSVRGEGPAWKPPRLGGNVAA